MYDVAGIICRHYLLVLNDGTPSGYCSPRHMVPLNSKDEGSKCVE